MFNNHAEIKKQFIELLRQLGEKFDGKISIILDIFFESDEHFSAPEIQEIAAERGHSIEIAQIKAVLNMFVNCGVARSLETDDGMKRYEHHHIDEHHDHLICTKCGKIIELSSDELEQFQQDITLKNQFYPFYHRLQIYGMCQDCLGKRKSLVPLSYASIGERVKIEEINGGQTLVKRLLEMGLQKGLQVKVLNNQGPFILQVGEMRLALGHGMANKIMVAPILNGSMSHA